MGKALELNLYKKAFIVDGGHSFVCEMSRVLMSRYIDILNFHPILTSKKSMYKDVFNPDDVNDIIDRINNLTPSTTPQWGKMNVGQMLAHLNVAYDMDLTDKYPKPGYLARIMMKLFVKNAVVGPKPYKKNGPTAPAFKVTEERDFKKEKERLIENINKVKDLGRSYYDGKESLSFGKLTEGEYSVMFSKHLDHHLTQFGV